MINFQQNLPPRRAKAPKQSKLLVAICRRSRHNEKTALCCCKMNRLYCHFGKLCCPPRLGAREDFRSIAQNCIEEAKEKVSYCTEKGMRCTSLDSTREHVFGLQEKFSTSTSGSSVLQSTGTASPIPDYPQRRTTLSKFEADCRGTEDADLQVVLGQAARCRDFAGNRGASNVLLTVYRERASLSLDPRKFKTRSNTPPTVDTLRVRCPELCKVDS